MEFMRLEANDYESALRLARERWGSAVRVHTRRDIVGPRGAKSCEITFYIVDRAATVRFDPKGHLDRLLKANAISAELDEVKALRAECEQLQYAEIEVRLIEALFASINYGGTHTPRLVLLQGAHAGTVAPALAVFFRARLGKRVAILSAGVDDPTLVDETTRLALPYYRRADLQERGPLDGYEHVIIIGDQEQVAEYFFDKELHRIGVVTADALESEGLDALLVTGLETAHQAGQLVSHLVTHQVAFAFITDSEGEVQSADSSSLLSRFVGFTLDLKALSFL